MEDAASDAAYYAIYRFDAGSSVNIEDAAHLLGTVRKQGAGLQTYTDNTAVDGSRYTYLVTAVDRLHNESPASNEITITNILDVTAPVTEAAVEGQKRGDWYVSDVSVTLSASDDLTGVVQTEYSLDNGQQWLRYQEPLTLTTDGEHLIQYRSTDLAGNIENAANIRIPIDRTPPVITIHGAQTYTVDQTVMITVLQPMPDPGLQIILVIHHW
ncbi:OmpL47-type beta-barrel domain-containing protein [Cohnella kolymensis]|uniref:OmpL47-type beta-barrel domain-containing protein n=1 Tax=Cohnella kolymensis TaxID=1590652 RepID=UPI0006979375|nr:hypothetical protein [Cohnella kolymensis]